MVMYVTTFISSRSPAEYYVVASLNVTEAMDKVEVLIRHNWRVYRISCPIAALMPPSFRG
jgi:hypothetical protein